MINNQLLMNQSNSKSILKNQPPPPSIYSFPKEKSSEKLVHQNKDQVMSNKVSSIIGKLNKNSDLARLFHSKKKLPFLKTEEFKEVKFSGDSQQSKKEKEVKRQQYQFQLSKRNILKIKEKQFKHDAYDNNLISIQEPEIEDQQIIAQKILEKRQSSTKDTSKRFWKTERNFKNTLQQLRSEIISEKPFDKAQLSVPKLSGRWIKIQRGDSQQVLSDFKRIKCVMQLHPSYPFRQKHLKDLQNTVNAIHQMQEQQFKNKEIKEETDDKSDLNEQVLLTSYSKRFTSSEKKRLEQTNPSIRPFKYACKQDLYKTQDLSKAQTRAPQSVQQIYQTQFTRTTSQPSFFQHRHSQHPALPSKSRARPTQQSQQSEHRNQQPTVLATSLPRTLTASNKPSEKQRKRVKSRNSASVRSLPSLQKATQVYKADQTRAVFSGRQPLTGTQETANADILVTQ